MEEKMMSFYVQIEGVHPANNTDNCPFCEGDNVANSDTIQINNRFLKIETRRCLDCAEEWATVLIKTRKGESNEDLLYPDLANRF